jgi:uncharacterized MAPEG superfamily protein
MTLALACIPVLWLLAFLPKTLAFFTIIRGGQRFDNAHPRTQQATLTGLSARATGAHFNTLEAVAPFAAAVLTDHVLGVRGGLADGLAVAFIALRLVYLALYLGNQPTFRSTVWVTALGVNVALFALPLCTTAVAH